MKNKVSKKSIAIGLTSLLLVTLILLGLTYAYYRTNINDNQNEKSISVTSKKYEVTYTDGDATLSTTGNIEPGFEYEKEFTVKNTGSESVNYSIILDNIENTFTRDQDWEYTLTKGDIEVATGTIAVGTHQVLIGSETLESGSATYKLVVTYKELNDVDQSEDMGQKMSFRVNISDETQTWDTAKSGTLLYAIKTNQPSGTGSTIPGQQASLETEARILSTQDDYGTSYVYRGNVTNNYVNYSGMCWRIVRVQGDGTIKLVLADENGECNADTYSTENTRSAFVDGTPYEYAYSDLTATTDFLFENSDILPKISNWSTKSVQRSGIEVPNLDTSKLVDAEWCTDTAITSVSREYSKYGAADRLNNVSTANPTLKCNTKGMEGTTGIEAVSQKYIGKIALLTADEVVFAGSTTYYQSGTTYNYYLQTNANYASDYDSYSYWTLSPYWSSFHNNNFLSFEVRNDGALSTNLLDCIYLFVRPAVVLNSNVLATTKSDTTTYGQPGTQTNPYVIS